MDSIFVLGFTAAVIGGLDSPLGAVVGGVMLGVGGMAGRPMTRTIAARDGASATDAIGQWAEELEGYDDLHASAAMRRDMFRKLAAHAVAEILQ